MRNYYLIAVLLLGLNSLASGQAHLSTNRPTLAYSGPDTVRLNANVTIDNNSTQTLHLVVERINKIMTPGHSTYFCWTTCYDTSTTLSDPAVVGAGVSNSSFEGWVIPGGIPGRDTVTYRFYDNTGISDTLILTFTYEFGLTGIDELVRAKYSFSISGANPADEITSINYSVNGSQNPVLVISNILGSKIKELKLDPAYKSVSLPTADLPNGNYICTLIADNVRIGSKKLIINHR